MQKSVAFLSFAASSARRRRCARYVEIAHGVYSATPMFLAAGRQLRPVGFSRD